MSSNKYKKNTREDYRLLCNIIDNVKCISITSNSDTEGKTIIAKNLAMVFAKKGKKTLFIDCSLVDKKKVKAFDKNKVTGLIGMLEAIDKAKVGRVNGVNIEDIHLKSFIIDNQVIAEKVIPFLMPFVTTTKVLGFYLFRLSDSSEPGISRLRAPPFFLF